MVRIVPDAAERDVRLRAARAVASDPRPGVGVVLTAGARRASGRPGRIAGAATARVESAGVVTARVLTAGVATERVLTAVVAIGRVAIGRVAIGQGVTAKV